MAEETLVPQAGDVWVEDEGETMLVLSVESGRMRYCATWSHLIIEDDSTAMETMTLLVRDGKPYQPPTPAQVGDVITVECAVTRRASGRIVVTGMEWVSALRIVSEAREQHLFTVPIVVPVVPVQSLPPVTAAQA